jgi:hypothetical protein
MKPPLTILALMVMVSGCVPLREVSQVEGPAHPEIMLYDRCLLSGFDLNREKIDTQQSYIKSPAGKRYTIDVQPHQFDIDQKRSYVSALLYPIAADGSQLKGWRNGIWSFHFVVESNGVTQIIDQKWKYYFWLYCPLIYGAPN